MERKGAPFRIALLSRFCNRAGFFCNAIKSLSGLSLPVKILEKIFRPLGRESFVLIVLGLFLAYPDCLLAEKLKATIIYQARIIQHQEIIRSLQDPTRVAEEFELDFLPLSGKAETGHRERLQRAAMLVAIGSHALRLALQEGNGQPGLYALVAEPEALDLATDSGRWRGLPFSVPFATQLEVLRKLLPEAERVALVCSREQLREIERFRRVAEKLGFEADCGVVSQQNSLAVIERLYQRCDLFFMIPVPGLINRVTLDKMLELQARTRRPLIGLSPGFVRQGALLSINYTLSVMADFLCQGLTAYGLRGELIDVAEDFAGGEENLFTIFLNRDRATYFSVLPPAALEKNIVFVDGGGTL